MYASCFKGSRTNLVDPSVDARHDEHIRTPGHPADDSELIFLLLSLKELPATTERVVVGEATTTGDRDEAGVVRDDGVANRVVQGDVRGRNLGGASQFAGWTLKVKCRGAP